VDYTITVKVLYINPSTGLGSWSVLDTVSGNTYQQAIKRFISYETTGDVEYRKYYSWTLPSNGDYPAKVRVEFSISASGWVRPALQSGSATAGGGAIIDAWRESGTGTTLPLSQLSVSSTPISVTIGYSGTVSGSATTPFTLYGVDKDLTITLTAPGSVSSGGVTYTFVKWSTSDGDYTSNSVTITVAKGSSKSATAVYQAQGGPPPPPPPPSKTPTKLRLNATGTGYNVQLVARLTDNNGNPLSGKTIYFYYSYDNKTWIQIGTSTTDTNGYAYMKHTTTMPTYYKASFQGDSSYQPSEAYAFYNPPLVINLGLGTMYLPGEGISTPWLENMSGWSWEGIWTLNVTELYPVKEHLVALLWDGSNVRAVDLLNGTSLEIHLPERWRQSPPVIERGGMKIVQLNRPEALPVVKNIKVNGKEPYLVALAAWNPYKQPSGYDTSCWLSNGTTLAVYNLTFTYTFRNGTRVVFKEPVVVSTLKTTVAPIYSIGDMKQALILKVTLKWKYLPPARTGIQPQPPSSIVGVAVIGNIVYNGTLIDANATSKTFTVAITDDTWTLYSKGVTSITASAYWLSSMNTPEGPVAMQDPAQLSVAYVMPHIDSISEGQSLTANISVLDIKTNQPYSANIYIELRDNRTYSVVETYGPYYVPGQATITIDMPNTKQYVMAIYALPVPQKDKLVVPIPAVYPPRA